MVELNGNMTVEVMAKVKKEWKVMAEGREKNKDLMLKLMGYPTVSKES